MTEQTHWGWAVSGYMGLTHIIETLVAEGTHPAPQTLKELDDYAGRLKAAVEALRAREQEGRR